MRFLQKSPLRRHERTDACWKAEKNGEKEKDAKPKRATEAKNDDYIGFANTLGL